MTKTNPRFAILITGLPGAGKTSLARQLSRELSLPMLSRDVIKEAIFEAFGPHEPRAAIGAASVGVLYGLIKDIPGGVILESWINTEKGDEKHLESALKDAGIDRVYEIFCSCPGDLAAERYAERRRSAAHRSDPGVLDLIRSLGPKVKPLGLGPFLVVDTSRRVDTGEVAQWVKVQTSRPLSGRTMVP